MKVLLVNDSRFGITKVRVGYCDGVQESRVEQISDVVGPDQVALRDRSRFRNGIYRRKQIMN